MYGEVRNPVNRNTFPVHDLSSAKAQSTADSTVVPASSVNAILPSTSIEMLATLANPAGVKATPWTERSESGREM